MNSRFIFWQPNGQGCVDVDECEKNPCANGKCENSDGGFQCICHPFLMLDGTGTKCVLSELSFSFSFIISRFFSK